MTTIRQDEIVDDFHGQQVADPFRWLEDSSLVDTQTWLAEQNRINKEKLVQLPGRAQMNERLKQLSNYTKYGVPEQAGEYYYFLMHEGLKNQPVFVRTKQTKQGAEAEIVLDPNTLSENGTVALTNISLSADGRFLAYGLSINGSDWQQIRVRDLIRNNDLSEVLERIKFTYIAWKPDESGFYYSRFPAEGSVSVADQSSYNKVYFHTLGTDQSEDVLIYEEPEDKELSFSPRVSPDGQYIMLLAYRGTSPNTKIYFRQLKRDQSFIKLFDQEDARYEPVGQLNNRAYFLTNKDAPRGKVIAVDLSEPFAAKPKVIIAEQEKVIDQVHLTADGFIVLYKHNAYHHLHMYDVNGTSKGAIALPDMGTVSMLKAKSSEQEFFLGLASYLFPTRVYRYQTGEQILQLAFDSDLDFTVEQYETKQVSYPSKDGTHISMFITHRKGLELNGENPTLLYGYGGFNVSLTPMFSPSVLHWLELGGVYAVANLRGGNEYGEEWHQMGMLDHKQNVFDDFIAAAEWLIAQGYTKSSKLAISGRSNGGLLVAACMMQRPDLYGAVICGVPVIDMLRYHRFTVGRYWVPEYGNAEVSAEQFQTLYAYSPLHNVRAGVDYPPILIATADTDDRVVPAHAYKFTATLQQANSNHEVILRVEMDAGHGLGKPLSKWIEEETDTYAFLANKLGVKLGTLT